MKNKKLNFKKIENKHLLESLLQQDPSDSINLEHSSSNVAGGSGKFDQGIVDDRKDGSHYRYRLGSSN